MVLFRNRFKSVILIITLSFFFIAQQVDPEEQSPQELQKLKEKFKKKGPYVLGEIISGNKWGGKRHVKVIGQFKGRERIEGQWYWDEVTAGPANLLECQSRSEGQGTWIAIRK